MADELIHDLGVARAMVHQAHGTPETLDEMLNALTQLVGTFDAMQTPLRRSDSQFARGNARGIQTVTLLLGALVANVGQRQGELMAEHAAYAAAGPCEHLAAKRDGLRTCPDCGAQRG